MPDDWRAYRPAIWLAMLGIAIGLLFSPWYICALPLGAAAGIALKTRRIRRRRR
jgi:hypothetical protein